MKVGTTHKDISTGAAWLLSACALKCSLKWGNMRNPCSVLQVSQRTATSYVEEGGDDTKSAWPFDALGRTRDTMVATEGCQAARRS